MDGLNCGALQCVYGAIVVWHLTSLLSEVLQIGGLTPPNRRRSHMFDFEAFGWIFLLLPSTFFYMVGTLEFRGLP